MSVSTSIDLRIVQSMSGTIVSPMKILEKLVSNGWNLFDKKGCVSYLPVGDDDMFNWTGKKMNGTSLMEILKEKELIGELIGVGLTWKSTGIGGEVLLRQEKEMQRKGIHVSMSFCLTRNRKLLSDYDCLKITDVNWYLTKLLPIFNQGNTLVEYFSYEEYF